jgi:hypothetical protein
MVEAVEFLIARFDLKHLVSPFGQMTMRVSATRLSNAMIGRVIDGLSVADRIEQARVPRFAGLECEFETNPAVGVDWLGIEFLRSEGKPPLVVLVDLSDR